MKKRALLEPDKLAFLTVQKILKQLKKNNGNVKSYDGIFKNYLVIIISANTKYVECYKYNPNDNSFTYDKIPFQVFSKYFIPIK